jgi:hypothetical protein
MNLKQIAIRYWTTKMRKQTHLLVTSLLVLTAITGASAQTSSTEPTQQLSGKVVNAENQPIPYATIYFRNTSYGTVAGLNGEFSIASLTDNNTLIVSSVGYNDLEKAINMNQPNDQLVLILTSNSTAIGEVLVISSDKQNLAKQIITKVRDNRKMYLNNVSRYTCNVYSKTSIEYGNPDSSKLKESDLLNKEKVNFIESYSELSFVNPDKYKELKLGYKDLGKRDQSQFSMEFSFQGKDAYEQQVTLNNPLLFEPDRSEVDFNFYKSIIDIPSFNENPYPSPIGPSALILYNFEVENSFFENNKKIYKIKVEPRLKNSYLFEGFLFIEDEKFAIIGTELSIPAHSLKFFKYFKLIQRYKEVAPDQYVLEDEEFSYHTNLSKDKSAHGNTLLRYSNYKLGDKTSASLNNGSTIFAENAYEKSDSFWNSVRPNTLKPREVSFIRIQDSIRTYRKSPAYIRHLDSFPRKIGIWDITLNGVWIQNRKKKTTLFFNSLLNTVKPFAVGGYRQSVSGWWNKEWTKANALKIGYDVNYGFKNKNFKGALSAQYTYLPKKFGSFRMSGSNTYDMLNDYESLAATFSRSNYVDKIKYGVGTVYELFNGVLVDAHAGYAQYTSIEDLRLADWSEDLFGSDNDPRNFQEYNEVLLDINLTLVPFQKYVMTPYKKLIKGSKYPTFKVHYKKGISGILSSDVDYDYLQLSASQDIQLRSFGLLNYKVFAGRFINDKQIRIADRKYFRGSDPFLFSDPLRSFQLLGPSISTTDNYLQSQFIHHFNGAIMNKIPLINRLRVHAFGGGGALYVQDNNFQHIEFYTGIERTVRIKKQLFRFSGAYVVANSTQSDIATGYKFGIDFYNSFTNKWSY